MFFYEWEGSKRFDVSFVGLTVTSVRAHVTPKVIKAANTCSVVNNSEAMTTITPEFTGTWKFQLYQALYHKTFAENADSIKKSRSIYSSSCRSNSSQHDLFPKGVSWARSISRWLVFHDA